MKAENKEDLAYDEDQELKGTEDEFKQNLNSILEADEIARSHANTYEQSREKCFFLACNKS